MAESGSELPTMEPAIPRPAADVEPIVLISRPLERKYSESVLFLSSVQGWPQPLFILARFQDFHKNSQRWTPRRGIDRKAVGLGRNNRRRLRLSQFASDRNGRAARQNPSWRLVECNPKIEPMARSMPHSCLSGVLLALVVATGLAKGRDASDQAPAP